MFERFTDRGRRVLVLAQEEARLLNHDFLGTEHILLGLSREGEGIAARALESLGLTLGALREKIEETAGPSAPSTTGSPPFTRRAKRVLEFSLREALQLGHDYIGTEHLLLGLVREGEGVGTRVLVSLGADLARVRECVIRLLSGDEIGGLVAEERHLPAQAGGMPPATGGPRCPSCRSLLEGRVAYRVLPVPPEPDPGVDPLRVAFVYCLRCGVTIAHAPSGPEGSLLSTQLGNTVVFSSTSSRLRRPAPARDFPHELWTASPPTTAPPTAVVDVRYTRRSSGHDRLSGTVAGSTVDLELPSPEATASGTLDDQAVDVAWKLAYDSTDDSGLPATLRGTVGERSVDLHGVFRPKPGALFGRASIEGILAGTRLAASVERASGGYGTTDTVVATGTLADQPFEIFAALGGSVELGRVRGTYDGQPVYLDLTQADRTEARVSGSCPSPPAFCLLIIGALRRFG